MIVNSFPRRERISLTSVGLAFAGSALFILGFRVLVDTPNSNSKTSDLAAIGAAVQGGWNAVLSAGTCSRELVLSGPVYSADNRIERWVQNSRPNGK